MCASRGKRRCLREGARSVDLDFQSRGLCSGSSFQFEEKPRAFAEMKVRATGASGRGRRRVQFCPTPAKRKFLSQGTRAPGGIFSSCAEAFTLIRKSACCPLKSAACRSEEHTSELQSQSNIVCRL